MKISQSGNGRSILVAIHEICRHDRCFFAGLHRKFVLNVEMDDNDNLVVLIDSFPMVWRPFWLPMMQKKVSDKPTSSGEKHQVELSTSNVLLKTTLLKERGGFGREGRPAIIRPPGSGRSEAPPRREMRSTAARRRERRLRRAAAHGATRGGGRDEAPPVGGRRGVAPAAGGGRG